MTLPSIPFRVSFRVEGQPLPKQSFRARNRHKGYTDPRVKAHQDAVSWKAKEAMKGSKPYDDNVTVSYVFRRSDHRRCDYTNMAKLVDDAMNGIVYDDDSRITAAHVYLERGAVEAETVVVVEAL